MDIKKKLVKSPIIHVALATGISIVSIAYVSKHLLGGSCSTVALAIPPLIMTAHAYVINRHPNSKYSKTRYWIGGILFYTVGVIICGIL